MCEEVGVCEVCVCEGGDMYEVCVCVREGVCTRRWDMCEEVCVREGVCMRKWGCVRRCVCV